MPLRAKERKMEITFTRVKSPGSNRICWNVNRGAQAFGQIWTFKVKGEKHGHHAQTRNGGYMLFVGRNSFEEAQEFVKNEAAR